MGVIKTDFSLLKPASIGKGAFGAKTTELARFKDAFEKKGIVTPPYVSLSVDFFHNALVRAGLVKEDGTYAFSAFTGHRILSKEEIKFNKRELTVLRAIFNRFQDYVVAIRSDERTAKGIGLYDTGFMLALNSSDKFNLFLDKIKTILLCQFDRSALAFVGRVGLPHGIGIQFMPLVAFHNTKNNSLFPLISIAGFTAKDSDKILFHLGAGIGGGVAVNSTYHIYDSHEASLINSVDASSNFSLFRLNTNESNHGLSLVDYVHHFFPSTELQKFLPKLLELAKELKKDFYFELQLFDLEGHWAVTQVAEHVWPKVEIPKGKINLETHGHGTFSGSGVIECPSVFVGVSDSDHPDQLIRDELIIPIPDNTRPLVALDSITLTSFCSLSKAGAIVEFGNHGRPLTSHVKGVYREAGIIVIDGSGLGRTIFDVIRVKDTQRVIVWADEPKGHAGITIL